MTDEKGLASTANDALPYGHYRVDETKAPEGYLNEGRISLEFDITEDGKIVELTETGSSIENQIIRGDLELVKVSDGDLSRLAGVPFTITSKTTGESHTIVTDQNGYAAHPLNGINIRPIPTGARLRKTVSGSAPPSRMTPKAP